MAIEVGALVRVTIEDVDDGNGGTFAAYVARDIEGNEVTDEAFPDNDDGTTSRHLVAVSKTPRKRLTYKRTDSTWRTVVDSEYDSRHRRHMAKQAQTDSASGNQTAVTPAPAPTDIVPDADEEAEPDFTAEVTPEEHHAHILAAVLGAEDKKPEDLIMPPLLWKLVVRNALRPVHTLITGEKGGGKSFLMKTVARVLGMKYVEIPLNAVVGHAREMLIGTMMADPKRGTYFNRARFLEAIQTPYTLIGLDEMSRADADTQNILLQATNPGQGYVTVEEEEGSPVYGVAEGVVFFATANIGMQYSATRMIDAALLDRFMQVEMPWMDIHGENKLLGMRFPKLHPVLRNAIADIAIQTRVDVKSETSTLNGQAISTRETERMAGLLVDGFTLAEAVELALYPMFSTDGGTTSPRSFVRQVVQAHLEDDTVADLFSNAGNPNGGGVPWLLP